jgi:hypothetical protein
MKKKNSIIGMPYTKEQLEKMRHYDLYTIAAELKIPRRPDGKYGAKEDMIPKILEAQDFMLKGRYLIARCAANTHCSGRRAIFVVRETKAGRTS